MKRRALLLLTSVSGITGIWACSSGSSSTNDTATPADAGNNTVTQGQDSATVLAEQPGSDGGGSDVDSAATAETKNPIANIAALVEVAPNTESPGGYFDSVRQWYDAGLMFTDPSSGAAGGGILFQFASGTATPFRTPSNMSLGSAIDNHRALVTAEADVSGSMAGRVVRTLPNGTYSIVASAWDAGGVGVSFDSPNDVTVRKSDGTVYMTDPGYQNPDAGTNRVFLIDPTGSARVADSCDTLCRPNGIALSPSESLLYVGFSGPFDDKSVPYILAYPVATNGTLGTGVKFASVGTNLDGLATDDAGNVYAAYASGVAVFDSTGKKWGDINVPKQPNAVSFGDADRKTLYIAANAASGPSIYTVRVSIAGRVE